MCFQLSPKSKLNSVLLLLPLPPFPSILNLSFLEIKTSKKYLKAWGRRGGAGQGRLEGVNGESGNIYFQYKNLKYIY